MAGVKETKEVCVAAAAIGVVITKLVADGVQFSDALELMNKIYGDPVLKAKFDDALDNIVAVKDEIKDLNVTEVVEIAMAVGNEILTGLSN